MASQHQKHHVIMFEESDGIERTAAATADDNFKRINLIYSHIQSDLHFFSQSNSCVLSMRHDDGEMKARKSLLQIYLTEPNKSLLISHSQMHESKAINITTTNEVNQRAKKSKNASTKLINT